MGRTIIDYVDDPYQVFYSGCCNGSEVAFFGVLQHEKRYINYNKSRCLEMLESMIQWSIDDRKIAQFFFDSAPPSIRFARFSDCFINYTTDIIEEYDYLKQDPNTAQNLKEEFANIEARARNLQEGALMQAKTEVFEPMKEAVFETIKQYNRSRKYRHIPGLPKLAHRKWEQISKEWLPSYPPAYYIKDIGASAMNKGYVIHEQFDEKRLVRVSLYNN